METGGGQASSSSGAVAADAAVDAEMMPEPTPKRDLPTGTDRDDTRAQRPKTIGGLCVNVASRAIFVAALAVAVVSGPVYGALSGELLDPALVEEGRKRERDLMSQFGVYERVHASKAKGKRVRSKWLDDNRRDDAGQVFVRSRLVAMEIAWDARHDTFAGTPPLMAVRLGLALACRGPASSCVSTTSQWLSTTR